MAGTVVPGTAAVGAVGAGVGAVFYAGFRYFHSGSLGAADDAAGPDLSPIAGIEDVVSTSTPAESCTANVFADAYLDHLPYLYGLLIALTLAAIAWIFYPAYVARKGGDMPAVTEEMLCPPTPKSSSKFPPSKDVSTDSIPMLSIVIPAYNEQHRLPTMLDSTLKHLRESRMDVSVHCRDALEALYSKDELKRASSSIEIIVVSDGSTDDTESIVRSYTDEVMRADPSNCLRLVKLGRNCGKGAAVREGMARSFGMLCLMVDADGATEFGSGLKKVLKEMKNVFLQNRSSSIANGAISNNEPPICAVFGSRAHMEEDSTASRSVVRTFLMHAFHFFVKCFCSANVRDTQCGFKLFTREAASVLSYNLHLRRWAFDTELVVMMERKGWPIAEVPVTWHEVGGSKIDESKLALALNSLGMLRDMICVRACYTLRLWTLSTPDDSDVSAR